MNRMLVCSLIFLVSCRMPGGASPRVSMTKVAGIAVAINGIYESARIQGWPAERKAAELDSVFARNGVTLKDYRTTVAWLSEDPVRWKEVGEELIRSGGGTAPPAYQR
jgi:hypothetical protein